MNTEKEKSFTSAKLIWAIILVLFGVLLLIGLFKFGSILAFFMVYPWILTKVSGVVFNQYLAQLIALPVAVVLVWAVIKLIFSFNQKKRNAGFIILAILFMIHSAFMFFVTREQYFQPLTGVPLKYYTINPLTGEIQVFDQPIFDVFGQKAKVMDPQVTQEYKARKMYPNTEIPADKIVNFFDRSTGKSLIWYCIDPDSSYHFFLQPGFSTVTGDSLRSITREVVKKFLETKQSEQMVNVPTSIEKETKEKEIAKKNNLKISQGSNQEILMNYIKNTKDLLIPKADISWYFIDKNLVGVDSENSKDVYINLSRESQRKVNFENPEYNYLYIERLLFIPSLYTIIGICFDTNFTRINEYTSGPFYIEIDGIYIIDNDGSSYPPVKIITNEPVRNSMIRLSHGQVKRVLYVFNYISPEKLNQASFNFRGLIIKFTSKK